VSQTPVRLTRRGALAALKGLRQPGNVPLVSDTTAEAAHLAGSSDVDRGGACWAPHGSMYFDQRGDVRACCQNTHVVLGNVTKQSLHEIWRSADAERMRTALEQHDYSQGCEFCEWQVREGNAQIVFARNFDQLRPIHANRSDWPSMMEFSLTNTCNLQCVMCSGEFSSAIRAQREHKQPLPKVYGEEFFEQLAEFLPHLSEARFLGGEPFLGREPLRVLDMLADLDDPPAVAITTNGTVFNAKVAAILDQLRPSIVVSIDAATAATFEAIRVGASFSEVIGNIERFCNAVGPSRVSLAHCLMTTNWSEFADLLEFAEHRGMEVGVNIVRFPAEHSLYHLEADELGPIVDVLHGTTVSLTGARAEVWTQQLDALSHRLAVVRGGAAHGPVHGLPGAISESGLPFAEHAAPGAPPVLPAPASNGVALIAVDSTGVVTIERVDDDFPIQMDDLDGAVLWKLVQRLERHHGPTSRWLPAPLSPPQPDVVSVWFPTSEPGVPYEGRMTAERDADGHLVGASIRLQPRGPGSDSPNSGS
jgi:radical SAM protein with 4Fe4S-binding SPASM domain